MAVRPGSSSGVPRQSSAAGIRMRLWFFLTECEWETLRREGLYRISADSADELSADERFAYRWLRRQMEKEIGPCPADVVRPIWGWMKWHNRTDMPDLRRREFQFAEPTVCIEAVMPAGQCVRTDRDMWRAVCRGENLALDEAKLRPIGAGIGLKKSGRGDARRPPLLTSTWHALFDMIRCEENEEWGRPQNVIAHVWSLRIECVKSVRACRIPAPRKTKKVPWWKALPANERVQDDAAGTNC